MYEVRRLPETRRETEERKWVTAAEAGSRAGFWLFDLSAVVMENFKCRSGRTDKLAVPSWLGSYGAIDWLVDVHRL